MRALLFLFLAVPALAGTADVQVQGNDTRKFISLWTPDGFANIEVRKLPVPAIRIENECGKVILDTYMLKSSEKELFKAFE